MNKKNGDTKLFQCEPKDYVACTAHEIHQQDLQTDASKKQLPFSSLKAVSLMEEHRKHK